MIELLQVLGGWALLNSSRLEFSNDMSCVLRGKFMLFGGMKAIEREWKIERQHSEDNPWNRLNSIYSQIFHAILSHQVDKIGW
jgi:hypothetical protein